MKKTVIAALIAGASLVPAAAFAQAAPAAATATPTVGANVVGADDEPVGTIASVSGSNVVLKVDDLSATIPANSLAPTEGGYKFTMTKDQLLAALGAQKGAAQEKRDAALVVAAPVLSKDGVTVATIQKIEGDNVTLDIVDGGVVALNKNAFGLNAQGALALGMTSAQFKAAVASASQSAGSEQAGADASADAGTQAAATDSTSGE